LRKFAPQCDSADTLTLETGAETASACRSADFSPDRFAQWFTSAYLLALTARSLRFAPDGGEQWIATIDTDVAGDATSSPPSGNGQEASF